MDERCAGRFYALRFVRICGRVMATYIEVNSKKKNTIVLKAFTLSFLFVIVFTAAYMIGAAIIQDIGMTERGGFFAVWGPVSLIAIVGALVCCLPMLGLQDKILVPVSFLFILVYYLIILFIFLFSADAVDRPLILQLVNLYALPPALFGNLIGWSLYAIWRNAETKRIRGRGAATPDQTAGKSA